MITVHMCVCIIMTNVQLTDYIERTYDQIHNLSCIYNVAFVEVISVIVSQSKCLSANKSTTLVL